MSTFNDLEHTAMAVLEILKTVPELAHTKVAIIGGLALWKYLRGYRATQVILIFRCKILTKQLLI